MLNSKMTRQQKIDKLKEVSKKSPIWEEKRAKYSRIQKLITEKENFEEKLLRLEKFIYSEEVEYSEEFLDLDTKERGFLEAEYFLMVELVDQKRKRIDYLKNK